MLAAKTDLPGEGFVPDGGPGAEVAASTGATTHAAREDSSAATPTERLLAAAGGALGGAVLSLATGYDSLLALITVTGFAAALALASVIDLREHRIPNVLNGVGLLLAVLLAFVFVGIPGLVDAIMGMLFAGGVMLVAWFAGGGRLGMGDVKLAAFVGAIVGPQGAPLFLATGFLVGAVVAGVLLASGLSRRHAFAYGPSLAVGALIAALVSGPVLS